MVIVSNCVQVSKRLERADIVGSANSKRVEIHCRSKRNKSADLNTIGNRGTVSYSELNHSSYRDIFYILPSQPSVNHCSPGYNLSLPWQKLRTP